MQRVNNIITIASEEILVRVHASSVNPVDVKMIEGSTTSNCNVSCYWHLILGLYSLVLWRKLPARCGFDVRSCSVTVKTKSYVPRWAVLSSALVREWPSSSPAMKSSAWPALVALVLGQNLPSSKSESFAWSPNQFVSKAGMSNYHRILNVGRYSAH